MKRSQFLFNVKMISVASTLLLLLHQSYIVSMPSAVDQNAPVVEVPPIPQDQQFGQFPTAAPEQFTGGAAPSEEKVGVQGNWMKKKDWLIKSNEVLDEIQTVALEIQGMRKIFNEKYHRIDEELDIFYKTVSLDQGKLQELFEELERYLEKKKKKKIEELSTVKKEEVSEKDYLLKVDLLNIEVKQQKEDLDQLKLDLKSIDDLDKSIVERIKRVDEQIAQAKELFDKATGSIEELWNIIDDKKARIIYYELKGSTLEKLKNILSYLKEDLLRDFDSVAETARTQMNKAKGSIKALEDKGFIVKNRSQRIEQLKLRELQKIEQAKKDIASIPTKDELIDLRKIKKQPTYWYEKAYAYAVNIISQVYLFTASFFGFEPQTKTPKQLTTQPIKIVQPIVPSTPLATEMPQIPTSTTQNTIPLSSSPMPLAIPSAPTTAPQPLTIPLPADALGGMPLN